MKETTAFDWELTVKLTGGKPATAKEILEIFLTELPQSKKLINQACEQHDMKALYLHLHKLNGGCSFCGVPVLKAITQEFTYATRAPHTETLTVLLKKFNQAVDEVLAATKDFVPPV